MATVKKNVLKNLQTIKEYIPVLKVLFAKLLQLGANAWSVEIWKYVSVLIWREGQGWVSHKYAVNMSCRGTKINVN